MMRSVLLVLGAVYFVACGSSHRARLDGDAPTLDANTEDARVADAKRLVDGPVADGSLGGSCNVLTQTGCLAGDKCTWIIDTAGPPSTGHIGCAPDGTAAVGSACTQGTPGPMGYDDCTAGGYCLQEAGASTCHEICDQNGGAPTCATTGGAAGLGFACMTYNGVFGPANMAVAAGVCDPVCDALADNDFLTGANAKSGVGYSASTGNVCGNDQGCYGYFDSSGNGVSQFTCSDAPNCASGSGFTDCDLVSYSAIPLDSAFINACSEGYEPLIYYDSAHSMVACLALCAPADCYTGSCGAGNTVSPTEGNLIGAGNGTDTVHQCTTGDARGTFFPSTLGSNGLNATHCIYSWAFEEGANGDLYTSPTSNVLGVCEDNSTMSGGLGCFWDPTYPGFGSNYTEECEKCDLVPNGSGFGNPIAACTPATGAGSDACFTGNAGDWNCVTYQEAGFAGSGGSGIRVFKKPVYRKQIRKEMGRRMFHSAKPAAL
jgi:hypothetical protein